MGPFRFVFMSDFQETLSWPLALCLPAGYVWSAESTLYITQTTIQNTFTYRRLLFQQHQIQDVVLIVSHQVTDQRDAAGITVVGEA